MTTRISALFACCVFLSVNLAGAGDDSAPILLPKAKVSAKGGITLAELQKKAAAGDRDANYEMGERYLRGNGVLRDVTHAMALLEKAAEAGSADATFRLGKLYEDGELVPEDYKKAFGYYRTAAQAGNAMAQYNLGAMYASARGTKRDYVEGLAWVILATRNGADPAGEQEVRSHLVKTRRTKSIPLAEARAKELAREFAGAVKNGLSETTGTNSHLAPAKTQTPPKVDLGKNGGDRITIAPLPAQPPPSFNVPPPPPPPAPPPATSTAP